jgi:hypothetical protein
MAIYPDGSTLLHRCAELLAEGRHADAGEKAARLVQRAHVQPARPQDFVARHQQQQHQQQQQGGSVAGEDESLSGATSPQHLDDTGPSTSSGMPADRWTGARWAPL